MSKKKRKKPIAKTVSFNTIKYIKEAARKLPIHQTLLDMSMDEVGMGYVIVSRQRSNGQIVFVNFLVDKYCLGVKDIFFDIMEEEDYTSMIEEMHERDDTNLVDAEPNHIYNLVYGAVEYAEDLGFQPHKDFDIAEYILDDVESITYEEIEFGKDGMPCFIAGPGDKTGRIISTLTKNVGEGNFVYFLEKDFEDLDEVDSEEE
jgi:hypothetical protein